MAVAVAGSTVHFILAFVMLIALYSLVGMPNSSQVQIQGLNQVGGVAGPAAVGGMRSGDIVVSIDGRTIGGRLETLTRAVNDHPDRPLTVVVERNGTHGTLTVTPVNGRALHEEGSATAGRDRPLRAHRGESRLPTGPARSSVPSTSAGSELLSVAWASVYSIAHLFSPSGIRAAVRPGRKRQGRRVGGGRRHPGPSIVGIGQTATDALQAGIGAYLYILIVINIFFGVFNLFPMLPLDGGHVAIAVYEKIRTGGRKVIYHADVAKLMPFAWVFMLFLAVLIVPALLTDILHPGQPLRLRGATPGCPDGWRQQGMRTGERDRRP